MTHLELEEASEEEKSAIEQQERFIEDAAKRSAARKVKAKEEAKRALLENLASKGQRNGVPKK